MEDRLVNDQVAEQHQAPTRTNPLAIISLVASLFCLLGVLPAIICGHIARSQCRKDPTLGGQGMAPAGLIIGYVTPVLIAAAILLLILVSVAGTESAPFIYGM